MPAAGVGAEMWRSGRFDEPSMLDAIGAGGRIGSVGFPPRRPCKSLSALPGQRSQLQGLH